MEAKLNILIALISAIVVFVVASRFVGVFRSRLNGELQQGVLKELIAEGKYADAVNAASRYCQRFPGEPFFLWQKGVALFKLGRKEEAVEVFSQLEQEEPIWREDAAKYLAALKDET